jgi:hypothetical protein
MWQICQPYAPAAFTPQEIFLVLISVRGPLDPKSMKNPMTLSGNRIRDIPPCSAVNQSTAPPRNPVRHFVAKKFTWTKTHLPFAEPSNFFWQPYKRATKYNSWKNVLTMSGSRYLSTVRGGYGICYWIIRIPKHSYALKTKEERRQINVRITYSQKRHYFFHPLSLYVIVASFLTPPPKKKFRLIRVINFDSSTITNMTMAPNCYVLQIICKHILCLCNFFTKI